MAGGERWSGLVIQKGVTGRQSSSGTAARLSGGDHRLPRRETRLPNQASVEEDCQGLLPGRCSGPVGAPCFGPPWTVPKRPLRSGFPARPVSLTRVPTGKARRSSSISDQTGRAGERLLTCERELYQQDERRGRSRQYSRIVTCVRAPPKRI